MLSTLRIRFAQVLHGQGIAATLVRGGAISFVMASTALALGFATNILIARTLGVSGYGAFSIILSWCMILAIPATAGMDFAILRYAPVYFDEAKTYLLWSLARFAALATTLASLLAAILVFSIVLWRPQWLGGAGLLGGALMASFIAVSAYLIVFAAFFRARKDVFFYQLYSQVLRAIIIVLALAAFVYIGATLSVLNVLQIFLAAAIACLLLQILHLLTVFGRDKNSNGKDSGQPRLWLAMGLPALIAAVMQQILMQSSLPILGIVSTTEQSGLYAASSRLAIFVTFSLSALASVTAPMIVKANTAKDHASLQRIATLNARLSLLGAIPVALIFVLAGKQVLSIFGSEFSQGYIILVILTGAGVFNAATGACANLLMLTGHQNYLSRLMVAVVCCQIFLAFILAKNYGALGAALAVSISVIVSNSITSWKVWRELKVNSLKL